MQKLVSKLPIPGACRKLAEVISLRSSVEITGEYRERLDRTIQEIERLLTDLGPLDAGMMPSPVEPNAKFLGDLREPEVDVEKLVHGDDGPAAIAVDAEQSKVGLFHGKFLALEGGVSAFWTGGFCHRLIAAWRQFFASIFLVFLGGKTSSGRGSWPTFRPLSFLACVALGFLSFAGDVQAGRKHLESWYADALAAELGAKTEVRMRNGTRCDVLAVHHAIEVEFAEKWCEAIGQALNYSSQTGRTGAVALVLESPADERFLSRMREVISWHQLPIAVLVLRPFGAKSLELQGLDGLAGRARE